MKKTVTFEPHYLAMDGTWPHVQLIWPSTQREYDDIQQAREVAHRLTSKASDVRIVKVTREVVQPSRKKRTKR